MKFELGQVVVTHLAQDLLDACGHRPEELLARHQSGDWGDVSAEERRINEQGVHNNLSLVSSYHIASGHRLTVFTKADRSYTFVHVMPQRSDTAR